MTVKNNAECAFGVLSQGDGSWDEIAETLHGKQVWIPVEEVYNHYSGRVYALKCRQVRRQGSESGSREGTNTIAVYVGWTVARRFDLIIV